MGILVKQNERRTELQERIAAELREKAAQRDTSGPIDPTKDSGYVKDMGQTSEKIGLWLVGAVLIIAGVIAFVIFR